ncbi:MAG TPA: ribulose-phosphate 3-epimerase [Candidatus Coproplasma stercorigallinarum]|nr:ribulose-phosphate 3-epimerase [Candidatus Coproplasma stercorigallinarum]
METKIAPSILSADFSRMGDAIRLCEAGGADLIHCDVMDGSFVEPITFGGQMVKNIRPLTKLPLDVHLMIEHPKTQIKFFAEAGADIITVHYEACARISQGYLKETLELIKSYGVKCGAVVNPDVPVEELFPVFPLCDMVLLMSVFPGYGGQKFIPSVLEKIKSAREYAQTIGKPDMDIEVDGGINAQTAPLAISAGANVLVAGSAIFGAPDFAAAVKNLRQK